ncbi:transposase [Nonomuraea candida]|uniref:transposase n=1 Tax=Nonomuraea candida TaxID=359159 RepID=UPI0012FC309A|nr:transposase [Nonomuraea candida]
MACWHGPRGIQVEVITLGSGQLFKVTQRTNGRRYLVGYCATVGQLARHVDLADLVEVLAFPAKKRHPTPG